MKRFIQSLVTCCFVFSLHAHNINTYIATPQKLSLASFMDFVQLNDLEREDFQLYYHDILNELQTASSAEKKNVRLQKIEQQGMNSLEVKHPHWARELLAFLQKDTRFYENAHTFVVRYGVLEFYREAHVRANNSTWVKVRGFFNQTKEVVSGWFSSWKTKLRVS